MTDVDLTGGMLRIRDTKASLVETSRLGCRTTIERHPGSRPQDAPFFSTASGRPTPHALSPHSTKCSRAQTFLVTALAVPFASATSVMALRC